jgi:hypothetical protein
MSERLRTTIKEFNRDYIKIHEVTCVCGACVEVKVINTEIAAIEEVVAVNTSR